MAEMQEISTDLEMAIEHLNAAIMLIGQAGLNIHALGINHPAFTREDEIQLLVKFLAWKSQTQVIHEELTQFVLAWANNIK